MFSRILSERISIEIGRSVASSTISDPNAVPAAPKMTSAQAVRCFGYRFSLFLRVGKYRRNGLNRPFLRGSRNANWRKNKGIPCRLPQYRDYQAREQLSSDCVAHHHPSGRRLKSWKKLLISAIY
jgi:hypothetical protein